MIAGYFNRGSGARTGTLDALCEPCGAKRWGDPFDTTIDAFANRISDRSGDWCWTGGLGGGVGDVPCIGCGS